MQSVVKGLSLTVFILVMAGTFLQASSNQGLNWIGESFPIVAFITSSILLILGIAFGTVFRQLNNIKEDTIKILPVISSIAKQRSFWISICVSPFVFFAVFAVVRSSPGDPASYLLAFQNGFFCESVFKKLTANESSVPPSVSSPVNVDTPP